MITYLSSELRYSERNSGYIPDLIERQIYKTLYALVLCVLEDITSDLAFNVIGNKFSFNIEPNISQSIAALTYSDDDISHIDSEIVKLSNIENQIELDLIMLRSRKNALIKQIQNSAKPDETVSNASFTNIYSVPMFFASIIIFTLCR